MANKKNEKNVYTLPAKYAKMTAEQILGTITDKSTEAQVEAIKMAAKFVLDRDFNTPAKQARFVEIFAHDSKAEKIRAYIDNPEYSYRSVKKNKDGYHVADSMKFIQFADLDKAYRQTDKKGFIYVHKDYMNRLNRTINTMLSYKDKAHNGDKGEGASVTACQKSLTNLLEAIIPEEVGLREMKGFDAKHFADAFIEVKNSETTDKRESECMKELIRGVYYPLHGLRYPKKQNQKNVEAQVKRDEKEAKKSEKK